MKEKMTRHQVAKAWCGERGYEVVFVALTKFHCRGRSGNVFAVNINMALSDLDAEFFEDGMIVSNKQTYISSLHESKIVFLAGQMSEEGFKKTVEVLLSESVKALKFGSITAEDMAEIADHSEKVLPDVFK